MYLWHMDTAGFQLSGRRAYIMIPMPVKSEEYVADVVEAWGREEMELNRMGPRAEDLPDMWRMTALQCLLTGMINEYIEVSAGGIE